MRHQPQIVFDEHISGVVVSRCHPLQAILFLFPGEGSGKGPRITRQAQSEKQTVQCQ